MQAGKNSSGAPQTLLPLLISTAGRAVKLPLGEGDGVFIALIRLLGAITSGCDAAARQSFEDPSNFFLMDLASAGSDTLGVSSTIQTCVCFFLGCCFAALEDPILSEGSGVRDSTLLNRKSFLSVIDTRIGLTRFNELLRRPLKSTHTAMNSTNSSSGGSCNSSGDIADQFFFSAGYEEFYRSQVECIKSSIFTFYSGADEGMKSIMESQEQRIAELESMLVLKKVSLSIGNGGERSIVGDTSNGKEGSGQGDGGGEWEWDGTEEGEEEGEEGGDKKGKAKGEASRTIKTEEEQSTRIADLESSLYESDSQVIALQQALFDKDKMQQEELQRVYDQFKLHGSGVEPSYDSKSNDINSGVCSKVTA
jgi:hypothetical protein